MRNQPTSGDETQKPLGAPVLGERAKWMALDGRDLYFEIMWQIKRSFGRNPMRYSRMHGEAAAHVLNQPVASLALFDRKSTGLWIDARPLADLLTEGAMHVATSGGAISSITNRWNEVERYVDVAAFSGMGDGSRYTQATRHLADGIRFGFAITLIAGSHALTTSPFFSVERMGDTEKLEALIEVMKDPNFVTGVLNPLAATGFLTITNMVHRGVGHVENQRLSENHFDIVRDLFIPRSEQRVEWVQDPWRPQLAPEFRRALRRTMVIDGKAEQAGIRETRLPDETSSGCPIRHQSRTPDGETISGIAVTNQICIDGLTEVLEHMLMLENAQSQSGVLELS